MLFLALITAVVLLQAWGTAARVQHDGWFDTWQALVASLALPAGVRLALTVLLPVLAVAVILRLAEPLLFGLLWIGLAAVLLLYAFGRGDFQEAMAHYRAHVANGDFEAAYLQACDRFGWARSRDDPATAEQAHALIQRALLYEGFQRWFAVLFYFVLLGPGGALAYRLLQLSGEDSLPSHRRRCLFLVDWVPARLLAASFALTGDFIGSRPALLNALQDTSLEADELLAGVAIEAVGEPSSPAAGDDDSLAAWAAAQNRELGALLSRSAVCWIAVLSLLVLAS